ncbi:MAG: 50S ribosomal protein L4 [bacterium]|nr:50S ribosomal protein L4 [bacterium]
MSATAQNKITVDVYNASGVVVSKQELPSDIFGVEVKEGVVHLAVLAQQANARPMVASTKTRAEVRGGGKKPWKQKGTGRARHGSIRSPLWRGGGITFGPRTDRNYSLKINKKARRKAVCMVLSQKVLDGQVILVDSLQFEKPTTKAAAAWLKVLPLTSKTKRAAKVAIVAPSGSTVVNKSFRNIPAANIVPAHSLNVIDLIQAQYLVMPVASITEIQKQLSEKKVVAKST